MPRPPRRGRLPALALALTLLAACEAGPSAFGEALQPPPGPTDSATAAQAGEIPRAPEVEPVRSELTGAGDALLSADRSGEGGAQPPLEDAAGSTGAAAALAAAAGEGPAEEPYSVIEPAGVPDGATLEFERPEHVRGVYLNAWAAGSARRVEQLIQMARATEINAFVIDIKDATGYVSHASRLPAVRAVGATGETRIRDLRGLLERLHEEGIWPIARIVIVKDPLLSAAHPDLAIQDTAGGVWRDGKETVWLNIHDERVWDYHVELAREVAELGFPEIQWDYVRFPDAPRSELARAWFPNSEGRSKEAAVRAFLDHSRQQLRGMGVEVTADVFGVTTSAGDVGIGQVWEDFIDVVDVALPMIYPSHYWRGSFGIERPNAFPYEIVKRALSDAVRRSEAVEGAGATRPWLQDFTMGEPAYGAPEVRAQIQAAYDVGVHEWIMWNPGSRYTVEAFEPVGGWAAEPHMRVGDMVVPVSDRNRVLSGELRPPPKAEPEPESETTEPAEETSADEDSLPDSLDLVDPLPVDSLPPTVDTVPPPDTVRVRGG